MDYPPEVADRIGSVIQVAREVVKYGPRGDEASGVWAVPAPLMRRLARAMSALDAAKDNPTQKEE